MFGGEFLGEYTKSHTKNVSFIGTASLTEQPQMKQKTLITNWIFVSGFNECNHWKGVLKASK